MGKKNCRYPKGVSGSVSKSRKRPFWDDGRNFFFCGKKSWLQCFLGWNLPEITVMLPSFQRYIGITVKIRKNLIFHCFFYFWPWSRNNYVMNATPLWFPVNFTPKNYTSRLNLRKKNFRFPKGASGSVLKSENDHFGMSDGNFFFFIENKADHRVFWGKIYRILP